jgi:hypothetical protein
MRYIKEVLIAVITAVLIAPASIYIGYKLNDYLSKDNISIERVDLIAETTNLPYPAKTIMELYQNPRFQDYLTSSRGLSYGLFNPRYYGISRGQFLQKEQIAEIIMLLENFSKFNEELQARENSAIQRLENYNPGDSIADIAPALQNIRYSIVLAHSQTDVEKVKILLDALQKEKINIEAVKKYKDDLLGILNSFKPERTGLVKIKLTLLNSGDTDGLIRPEGKLNFTTQTDPLPIIEDNKSGNVESILYVQDQFQSVPKRSMTQRNFILHESKAGPKSMNHFKSLVKRGEPVPITITVFDIRDDLIHSKNISLPIIQE